MVPATVSELKVGMDPVRSVLLCQNRSSYEFSETVIYLELSQQGHDQAY